MERPAFLRVFLGYVRTPFKGGEKGAFCGRLAAGCGVKATGGLFPLR